MSTSLRAALVAGVCLDLVLAAPLIGASDPTPAPSASPGQALQYVQTQFGGIAEITQMGVPLPTQPGLQNQLQMQAMAMLQSEVRDILQHAIDNLLSGVNPILGYVARSFANKLMDQITLPQIKVKEKQVATITTTIAGVRRRVDSADVTTIAQCDLKRFIIANNTTHSYYVLPFKDVTAGAKQAVSMTMQTQSCGEMRMHLDKNRDGQTATIAGVTGQHEIATVTVTMQGGSKCHGGRITGTREQWVADSGIPNQCPIAAGASEADVSGQSADIEIPLRQVQKVDVSQFLGSMSKQTQTTMNKLLTSRIEITSVKNVPYDASFMDVPAGYKQLDPPAGAMQFQVNQPGS